ncbi:hypothetical protein OIB37_20280 [Streptomyces sp. NBC_00820]|uniref:hypothetical protein n=1 Tax=Streptomyces sp. NBC_00820 TaxID=2975842 RepID=UPI002ED41D96|nr:hypothetical protein OIB37_20280 [Streptomyces sp. NBC_00820]
MAPRIAAARRAGPGKPADSAGPGQSAVQQGPLRIQEFTPPTGLIASIPDSGTEFPATYIHHCHILEHEDDDLMRPWTIVQD